VATFLAAYEESRGEPLESIAFGPLAADAVLVISQAYLASGKQLDSVAIGEAMLSLESFQLISVESASYQRDGGPDGTPQRDVYIVQNLDGEPTLLDQFVPASYGD
jgi:hypothetical protein